MIYPRPYSIYLKGTLDVAWSEVALIWVLSSGFRAAGFTSIVAMAEAYRVAIHVNSTLNP